MSKISRIRILNLIYNNNTIRIDDETFDLGGENTLISLRNGGGKSVLVQMIVSLFVNRTYRDFGDRAFKSYFTTNRPTFIMTEWQLDHGAGRFLAGMMVRKNQKEDHDAEELEMYTFTGSYSKACRYDLDNIPIIKNEGNKKILKGFAECRSIFEELSKDRSGDFRSYDMTARYGRNQYFTVLKQYQINHKEWESIIRKVNQKESGLSELFSNAKDEKDLVENWFLRPIEDKLNQEKNKIDEFRKLTFQFVEQYRSNQSRIQRKEIIERYFEDTKQLKADIDTYIEKDRNASELRSEVIIYAKALQEAVDQLEELISERKEKLAWVGEEIRRITYERLSYTIYEYEDKKSAAVSERYQQEVEITSLTSLRNRLLREINVYELGRIYAELRDYEIQKAEVDEKINALLQEAEDNKDEIEELGYTLYVFFNREVQKCNDGKIAKEAELHKAADDVSAADRERKDSENQIRQLSTTIGGLENKVKSYDEVEDTFNTESGCDIRRNILGFYEEGFLEITRKEMEEETQDEKNNLVRYTKKLNELELSDRRLDQEAGDKELKIRDTTHLIQAAVDQLSDLECQKNDRCRIMKYLGVDDFYVDKKDVILDHIDGKIKELDIARSEWIREKSDQEKHLNQLKEGKITELPDHIKDYMEQNGIDIVYGMEWLTRNGRTVQENTELVKNNPFIPYSIVMEKNTFERFKNVDEELYTSFPIPVIVRDELENVIEHAENHITTFGNVHFYVMFNTHLLDKAELEKILTDIKQKIKNLQKAIDDKDTDLKTYRDYRNKIENQTFSTALYQQTEKEISSRKAEMDQLEKRLSEIRHERSTIEEGKKETASLIEAAKKTIAQYANRIRQFDKLCKKYEQYETDKASLSRTVNEKDELVRKQSELGARINELREHMAELRLQVQQYEALTDQAQRKAAEFESYAELGRTAHSMAMEDMDAAQMEARFHALTKKISATMEDLKKSQMWFQDKILDKKAELARKNEGNHIEETEYKSLVYSDAQYDGLKRQEKQAGIELNKAIEKNNGLTGKIESLKTSISFCFKELKKETGYDEPVPRNTIVDTDFEKRIHVKEHDARLLEKEIENLDERKTDLSIHAKGVEEYADEIADVEGEELSAITAHIPDVRSADMDTVRVYQKDIKKKLADASKELAACQINMYETISTIASKEDYADDYFKKTFDSLLTQTGNPRNLSEQFEVNRASYENQLEKLKIDLASIDNEQKNIEAMFLEYIQQVNANIGMIDKNSTITVRNRNIKMLRIQVADWESEKEHFRLKLHDCFEGIVKLGIDTIEKNGNLNEFLGRVITTRKLYDDIVGINNVKIKLYKIEAEREVPISWSEVSANSGGEGFLSAFVILTCLLSYMRRDETDLFTSGEEGKVLIMDNPFAQTNAEHLLKPLVEMAKKTNTQLICLSALGGDSIYNRFDNIYVLKLLESNIRNGVQRIESYHKKGDDIKRLVLSDFKMEQVNLFDFIEE